MVKLQSEYLLLVAAQAMLVLLTRPHSMNALLMLYYFDFYAPCIYF